MLSLRSSPTTVASESRAKRAASPPSPVPASSTVRLSARKSRRPSSSPNPNRSTYQRVLGRRPAAGPPRCRRATTWPRTSRTCRSGRRAGPTRPARAAARRREREAMPVGARERAVVHVTVEAAHRGRSCTGIVGRRGRAGSSASSAAKDRKLRRSARLRRRHVGRTLRGQPNAPAKPGVAVEAPGTEPREPGAERSRRQPALRHRRRRIRERETLSPSRPRPSDMFGFKWHQRDTFESEVMMRPHAALARSSSTAT